VPIVERQFKLADHLAHVPDREVDEPPLPKTKQVTRSHQHDVPDIGPVDDIRQCAGEVLQDQDRLRPRIAELVLELPRRVQGVHVDDRETCAKNGGDRHHVLGQVGHHQRDTGAA